MCPYRRHQRTELHHGGTPPWASGVREKRRFLFMRFITFFAGLMGIFIVGLVVVLSLLFNRQLPPPGWLLSVVCAVPLVFMMLAGLVGSLAFRRIGSPVAEVMAAADQVANGNLDVRVHEEAPGEFGRLASSFNRMTAELARSDQQRRNFTADVAHELRTPLHIIQGNLEGILDGVYEATPEHINATLDETRLLARLVNDLQTLSLAESGQLPLHRRPLVVADLLSDVVTSFSNQAAAAGVRLETVYSADGDPSGIDLVIEADPDRLDQVLSNLVSNALRHTPAGGSITLQVVPCEGGARITVADTGSGISPEDLPFVFDRFWRGDRARTRHEGAGSGLGLAIARQLVQAHGGTIQVESRPGEGTCFTIDLPSKPRSTGE